MNNLAGLAGRGQRPRRTAPNMNALISVSDKTGIAELARALHELGVRLVSTGGTARLPMIQHSAASPASAGRTTTSAVSGRMKAMTCTSRFTRVRPIASHNADAGPMRNDGMAASATSRAGSAAAAQGPPISICTSCGAVMARPAATGRPISACRCARSP